MRISDWSSDVCSSDLLRIVTLWDMLRLDLGESPQHTIPLLSGLSLRQARVFALMSKLEKHAAAERVIEEGDLARDIYVVVDGRLEEIGRAHAGTPVTNAHLVCRPLLDKKNKHHNTTLR